MSAMKRRRLGNSSLELTPVGLGAWAIGGEWRFGWGPQDEAESIKTIHRAVERGMNWIDTAAVYGLGHSEEVVGRALKTIPAGDRPYVFTKCSLVWDANGNVSHSLRPDSIRREVEASLRRLQTERIDLYQIHWPAWPASPPGHDSGPLEPAWETLAALKKEGKVSWIGVSNMDADSLLRREIEQQILPYCLEQNIGVIPYSPMQSGLLTGTMTRDRIASLPEGDWRRNNRFFQEPQLSNALALVERLREVGARHGRKPGQVAIAWVRAHPAITAVIVGARRPDQVDELVSAGDFTLTPSEVEELRS
jgi:aryl-alcohol dehydrogenase-like predicted oxidoreductase